MGDITKHISWSEVECHDGCGEKNVDMNALFRFDKFIEEHLEGASVIIDRICSCAAHNRAVGGKSHSRHLSYTPKDNSIREIQKELKAFAIDIRKIHGYTIEQARTIAKLYWDGGIEDKVPWLHLDCGSKQVFYKT